MWLHSPSRAQTLLEMQAVKRKCVCNNEERHLQKRVAEIRGKIIFEVGRFGCVMPMNMIHYYSKIVHL